MNKEFSGESGKDKRHSMTPVEATVQGLLMAANNHLDLAAKTLIEHLGQLFRDQEFEKEQLLEHLSMPEADKRANRMFLDTLMRDIFLICLYQRKLKTRGICFRIWNPRYLKPNWIF
ncbi:hypothetical protein KJ853_01785 [Patescibacteria group bacterium]|nr:hypothetical protein [Patescibacteria group bacterium]